MLAERSGDIEWGTPVLFMRVPDGRIFDLGDQPGANRAALQSPTGQADPQTNGSAWTKSISVNYRQDDTAGHARALSERLAQHFGKENIHVAVSHTELGRQAQGGADGAFLTLIGPAWVQSLRPPAQWPTPKTSRVVRSNLPYAIGPNQ